MQIVLLFLLIVGGSTAASVLLLRGLRGKFPTVLSPEDHQIAGHFLGVVGGLYGVLLAFVVVLSWEQFNQAKIIVTREANEAGDLVRLAGNFPEATRSAVRAKVLSYEQVVIGREWPAMAAGGESREAWAALDDIWTAYRSYQPASEPQLQSYQLSLARLSDLSDDRRLRLLYSREKVPGILWALLILGGVATVSFTYLFRLRHVRAQYEMTAVVTALIAFILFLVMDFDQPFSGIIRVRPEVFGRELKRIHEYPGEQ